MDIWDAELIVADVLPIERSRPTCTFSRATACGRSRFYESCATSSEAGRTDEAMYIYEKLMAAWVTADPELHERREAVRARLEALRAGPGALTGCP